MARHEVFTADALGSVLAYAETVLGSRNFHLFHDIEDRRVNFRGVTARLIDIGAPIADWRFDARVLDVRLPDAFPVYYEGDERRYGGTEAETLRGIRRDYEKRLIDWFFADKPPVRLDSDEAKVCHWLIQHMPSVEEFIDEGFPVGAAA